MRINYVTAIIGRRGAGKSVYTRNFILEYKKLHPYHKIIVVSDENPNYVDFQHVNLSDLLRLPIDGLFRVWNNDIDKLLTAIHENIWNSLIIFEDSSKYIRKNLQPAVRQTVLDSKQRNTDIIFQFHGFSYVPPELFRVLDLLTLFKVNDTPEYRKSDIVAFHEVFNCYSLVMKNKNPYFHKTVKIY